MGQFLLQCDAFRVDKLYGHLLANDPSLVAERDAQRGGDLYKQHDLQVKKSRRIYICRLKFLQKKLHQI